MENIWGKKNYMFHKAVTLKAVIRVLGDIIEEDDFYENWQEQGQKLFLHKVQSWGALGKEFRADGFYERFAAKGQVERTRKIHEYLTKNLS